MIKAILTDIEGTTSKISFVHEVLFPYARRKIAEFIQAHYQDPAVKEQLDIIRDIQQQPELSLEDIVQTLHHWIDTDQKITPLKALQGQIWEKGYIAGDFTGHVYEDAQQQLTTWQAQGLKLYIYSSGSVQAQKLLFGHSDFGDLTPLFSNYFDTKVGGKKEMASYQEIVNQLPFHAEEVLFLSDVVEELDAASAAGLQTCQLIREGQPAGNHPTATTFFDIQL